MASSTLYPPTLNYSEPAFIVTEGQNNVCKINFALSDFSTTSEEQSIKGIQVSVIRQSTGQNVVNKVDDQTNKRYRKTGIILLSSSDIKQNTDGTYYIEIYDSDIQSGDESGWVAGWIYKVQLRLSLIDNYNPIDNPISQSLWLTQQGNNFSEWSTFCTVKATSKPDITITSLKTGIDNIITTSTLHFVGSYDNNDVSENLYSYSLSLLQGTDIIESSGLLYSNQYGSGKFDYTFKHELIDKTEYSVILSYSTINKYTETLSYSIVTEQSLEDAKEIYVVCAETAVPVPTHPSTSRPRPFCTNPVPEISNRVHAHRSSTHRRVCGSHRKRVDNRVFSFPGTGWFPTRNSAISKSGYVYSVRERVPPSFPVPETPDSEIPLSSTKPKSSPSTASPE